MTVLQKIGRHFRSRSEPTINDMLSDSIVLAVMEADGINPEALRAELMSMARQISTRGTRRPETLRPDLDCRLTVSSGHTR